jgi:uncharacterized protein (TIGR00369 family)
MRERVLSSAPWPYSRAPTAEEAQQENAVPDDRPHDPLESETMHGFNVVLGYRLAEWREDFARLELALEPKRLNRSGVVHGGVLATMLDVTLGYAGVFSAEPGRLRRAVTLSLTTSFLGQAKSGVLNCVARRRGGGKTIFMATGEVLDESGNPIALGEGTFRYIGERL